MAFNCERIMIQIKCDEGYAQVVMEEEGGIELKAYVESVSSPLHSPLTGIRALRRFPGGVMEVGKLQKADELKTNKP